MNYHPKGRPSYGNQNRERLPEGVRRLPNRRLVVDFQARFPDGTAFRRMREFEPDELKAAINFVTKAQAEFARGNGVGSIGANDGVLTVASWCEHCVTVAMPAQKNGKAPKYSDEALQGFQVIFRQYIAPGIGSVGLAELDKKTVSAFIASLPNNEARTKTLNLLTRAMQLAEAKGKRKKGTNPCKGVNATSPKAGEPAPEPENWAKARPSNWRESRED